MIILIGLNEKKKIIYIFDLKIDKSKTTKQQMK